MPKLTEEQYKFLTEIYDSIRSSAMNRTVEERFDFRTVLENLIIDLQENQTVNNKLLNVHNSVFDQSKHAKVLTADNLKELFDIYFEQKIATKLERQKVQTQVSAERKNGSVSEKADIYNMTCAQRAEYINKFRLEGAANLQRAQDVQAAVLQKTKDVASNKTMPELYMLYTSVCQTLTNFFGQRNIEFSIAVELRHQFFQAMQQKRLQTIMAIIQPLADVTNVRAEVIDENIVTINEPLSKAIDLLHEFLAAEIQQLNILSTSPFVPDRSKEIISQSIITGYDAISILTAVPQITAVPKNTSLRINAIVELIHDSNKLMLIDDVKEKAVYINAFSNLLARVLMLDIAAQYKLNKSSGKPNLSWPIFPEPIKMSSMFTAIGLKFAKLTAELMNSGDLNSVQFSEFVSWFSVFQRAIISGPDMKLFMRIHTRLQAEYINSLTSDQAGKYQQIFTARYGAEHGEKINQNFDVRMQKFCLDILELIDERINKLHQGSSLKRRQ